MPDTSELPEVTLRRYARALAALQSAHAPVTLYEDADICGHAEPEDETGAVRTGWDAWADDHPRGSGPADLVSGDRICTLTPAGSACPACSALVYGVRADEDDFVAAGDCIVLPVIGKALSEEITDD